jgi:hypothetical protein
VAGLIAGDDQGRLDNLSVLRIKLDDMEHTRLKVFRSAIDQYRIGHSEDLGCRREGPTRPEGCAHPALPADGVSARLARPRVARR